MNHKHVIAGLIFAGLAFGFTADTAIGASPAQTIINYGASAKQAQQAYVQSSTVPRFRTLRYRVGRFRSSRWAGVPLPIGWCTGKIKAPHPSPLQRCKFRNRDSSTIVWSSIKFYEDGAVKRFYVTLALSAEEHLG